MGRLGSGPHVVGRLGSGPHIVGRLGSGMRVSASFSNFHFNSRGNILGGEGNCPGSGNVRGNMSEGDMWSGGMSCTRRLTLPLEKM